MVSRLGINELSCDANAIAGLADAALQHVADAEFTPNLLDIDGFAFVGETGITRDDEQRFGPPQSRDDVVHHSIREIFLLRIGAQIGEGENRN